MDAPTPRPAKGEPIVAVDLLRFACALLVVWHHYALAMWRSGDVRVATALHDVGATPEPLAQSGLIGVELFFVISGLVIARSAVGVRWTTFLWHRALRLGPTVWICATLTALAVAAAGQGDAALIGEWSRSMRFWPIGTQIDGSYWTLGVECAFYLLVALAAAGRARRIMLVGWGLALGSALFWAASLILGERFGPLVTNQAAILLLLPHGCLFAIGIAIAQRGARGSSALLALALVTAIIEIAAHIDSGRIGTATLAAETIFVAGIALLLAAPRLQPWLVRHIGTDRARALGLTTFPLYLLHQVAGGVLIGGLARSGVPGGIATMLTLIAMLGLSWAIARHAEPALRGALVRAVSLFRAPARDTLRNASPPAG